jgi:hypothetical protein
MNAGLRFVTGPRHNPPAPAVPWKHLTHLRFLMGCGQILVRRSRARYFQPALS